MATSLKNLTEQKEISIPSAKSLKFGIVVSEFNHQITNALLEGAVNTLKHHFALDANIIVEPVPGSFEIPKAAQYLAEYKYPDAIICIGCIIRGETPHFDYISNGVTQGIMQLNLDYEIPFIFGVLTTDNLQQAEDRAGGKLGNKGEEAAVAAIRMAALHNRMTI